jgi:hypothetical protein
MRMSSRLACAVERRPPGDETGGASYLRRKSAQGKAAPKPSRR